MSVVLGLWFNVPVLIHSATHVAIHEVCSQCSKCINTRTLQSNSCVCLAIIVVKCDRFEKKYADCFRKYESQQNM
jgi:hypothetical protein